MSSPPGNFFFPLWVAESQQMILATVEDTRRARLGMLVAKYGGMAELYEKLGYARNETSGLTRILNANIRHERAGKAYVMGSPMARKIERTLGLPVGWMDTPPTYAELHGKEDPRAKVMELMEALPKDQWPTAARLLNALNQPPEPKSAENGTAG